MKKLLIFLLLSIPLLCWQTTDYNSVIHCQKGVTSQYSIFDDSQVFMFSTSDSMELLEVYPIILDIEGYLVYGIVRHGVYQCYDLEGVLGRVFAKATNVNVKILTIDNKLVETFTISAIGFTRAVNDLFDEEEM